MKFNSQSSQKLKQLLLAFVTCSLSFSAAAQGAKAPKDTTSTKKKYKVDVGGVIQVHMLHQPNSNGDSIIDPAGFRILRGRMFAKGRINKFTSYEIMADFRAPEQRGILRDAFISFDIFKNQQLRVGQQKTQFGYENPESITKLFFVNRSEMADALGRGLNLRDNGLGLLGHININKKWRFENAITFTNGAGLNVTRPNDFANTKNGWGRIGIRFKADSVSVRLGLSAGKGGINDIGDPLEPADDIFSHFKRYGSDLQIEHSRFFLAAEYAMGTDLILDTLNESFGYQITLAGKTKWNIGPTIRLDVYDDEWRRWVFGAYYGRPNDKLRILINYEYRGYVPPDMLIGGDDRFYIQCQVTF